MENKIVLENGISHTLTKDEMKLLRLSIKCFNWSEVICSEEREQELKKAYDNLYTLFWEHLD